MSATASAASTELAVNGIWQSASALIVVIALVFALAWLLRRYRQWHGQGSPLHITAGITVGPREKVLLIRAGTVDLLIGVAPGRVTNLHTFDAPVITDRPSDRLEPTPGSFVEQLGKLLKRPQEPA